MNGDWRDRVRADPKVSKPAKELADVVVSRFSASRVGYAAFYDTDAVVFLNGSTGDVIRWRKELADRGYLKQLHTVGSKPAYRLT